jgi:organic hydroperoxide reductase OsmC/OhrA
MRENEDGSGEFVRVVLKPVVRILRRDDRDKAFGLHTEAHHLCFIARSVNFDVKIEPEIVESTTVLAGVKPEL